MTRVLNVDLDFFVHGAAHMRSYDSDRLDPTEYPPWSLKNAISFLENQCGLAAKVPGFAVEHHGEVFGRWRTAIDRGELGVPFHVTHIDAHADLGLGDSSYVYLMSELLFEAVENRRHPKEGGWDGLGDGNYLAFAVACRWITDIVYVYNEGGGSDIPRFLMENFDSSAEHIELKAIAADGVDELLRGPPSRGRPSRATCAAETDSLRVFPCGRAFRHAVSGPITRLHPAS